MASEIASSFGATYGMQDLRTGGRRLRHDVQRRVAPVRRHLPSPGTRIIRSAHALQEHLIGLDTKSKAQRAIAIVGVKPVVAGLEGQTGSYAHGLVSSARHLEEDLLLALEQNLPVIDTPRGIHQAIGMDE